MSTPSLPQLHGSGPQPSRPGPCQFPADIAENGYCPCGHPLDQHGPRKIRVYIATRLENVEQHRLLTAALEKHGCEVTYDWTVHGGVWQADDPRRWETLQHVAQLETQAVIEADITIVLLPGGRGTHVELGIALGFGRPVLLWAPTPEHFEHFPACFYAHPAVRRLYVSPSEAAAIGEPDFPAGLLAFTARNIVDNQHAGRPAAATTTDRRGTS